MATGERRFSSEGQRPDKREFPELPEGEWALKVRADKAVIGKAQGVNKVPYVRLPFEALDSALTEGGKNLLYYHLFLLSLKPWTNGAIGPRQADQILGLAAATGVTLDVGTLEMDEVDPQTGEVVGTIEYLNPQDVLRYIKAMDGQIVHGKVKQVMERDQNDPKNKDGKKRARLDCFIESEEGNAFATPEEQEEQVEEEPEPEPVPLKKAAGKKGKR